MIPATERPAKPYGVRYIENPSQAEIRDLALQYTPSVFKSSAGNLNKISRNKARMAQYTYVIAPEADQHLYSAKTISRDKASEYIEKQRRYIEEQGELIQ